MDSRVAMEALAIGVSTGVPVLLWGSPGTGKTSAVRGLGEALGWPVDVVIGSIREPADFGGLPVVVSGEVRLAPPAWAERLSAEGRGLLFLDELTTAPPAMLRIVLERVVGDVALLAAVRVVAAANPPEEAADGWELSPPLANRLVHLDWLVEARRVAEGLAVGFPVPDLSIVDEVVEPAQALAARAAVAAFLQVRPGLVLQVPGGAAGVGRGWPSPRSWESVARLLAGCEAAKASPEARAVLVTGAPAAG
jgi:MoxR-like ATPase